MRTVFFYVTDTLADWECGHVLAELHSGRYLKAPDLRYDVLLCGTSMKPVTTMGGLRLEPDTRVADINPGPSDILVLPGADTWFDPASIQVINKAREVLDAGVPVAAICGATMALANAGLLDHRPHTSNDLSALKMFCPAYRGETYYRGSPAVTDGDLITASGLAPVEFAAEVFRRLDVMSPATLDAWYRLYTTRTPESFFALMQSLPPAKDTD